MLKGCVSQVDWNVAQRARGIQAHRIIGLVTWSHECRYTILVVNYEIARFIFLVGWVIRSCMKFSAYALIMETRRSIRNSRSISNNFDHLRLKKNVGKEMRLLSVHPYTLCIWYIFWQSFVNIFGSD